MMSVSIVIFFRMPIHVLKHDFFLNFKLHTYATGFLFHIDIHQTILYKYIQVSVYEYLTQITYFLCGHTSVNFLKYIS